MTSSGPITRREWEIRRPGELPLRGDLRHLAGSAPQRVVVVCHGFKGFRRWGFFPPLARDLARRGMAAVTFDFSRNGLGDDGVDFSALERFRENTHSRNVDEVHTVLRAVREKLLPQPPERIALLGHSRGGAEALIAAREDASVDGLVTWAAVSSFERWNPEDVARWERGEDVEIENARTGQRMPIGPDYWRDLKENRERLDPLRAAAGLVAPWLIVHGTADASVPPESAERLHAAIEGNSRLEMVPEADHVFGASHPWKGSTPLLRHAMQVTLEWLDGRLR